MIRYLILAFAISITPFAISDDTPMTRLVPVAAPSTYTAWTWTKRDSHHNAVVRVRTAFVRDSNGRGKASAGTGVMVSHSGPGALVLTASHVVEGNTMVKIISATTGNEFDAKVLYADKDSDFAVLYAEKANPRVTIPVGDFWPNQNDPIEVAGFGGPGETKLRHFAGRFIAQRQNHGFDVDAEVISGDSGSPMFCDGAVVGIVRGGREIRGEVIDKNGQSWGLNYPTQADIGGTHLCHVLRTVTARFGLIPRIVQRMRSNGQPQQQCRPGDPCYQGQPGTRPDTDIYPNDDSQQPVDLNPPANFEPVVTAPNCTDPACSCGCHPKPSPSVPTCEAGPAGPQGERGPAGRDGVDGADATVTAEQLGAIAAAITEQLKSDPSLKGPKGERGADGQGITAEQIADIKAQILAEIKFPDRRVVLVDGSTGKVIDDETYKADEPIVLDLKSVINAAKRR